MKWVQLKKVLVDDGVKDKDLVLFKVYDNEDELKKDLGNPDKFVKWISYPEEDPYHNEFELDRKAQRKYELFCGGFLHYHDNIFKKYGDGAGYEYPKNPGPGIAPTWKDYDGDTSFYHEIYFEWFPKSGKVNKKKSVIIHINPTPPKFNSDPPVPPPPPPPES